MISENLGETPELSNESMKDSYLEVELSQICITLYNIIKKDTSEKSVNLEMELKKQRKFFLAGKIRM